MAEVATPKSSLLRRTAQSVSNYQKQVTQDTNIKDLSEEQKSRLIYLKDDMLLDDPDNMEIYGESDVEALAEDMRKYGFQGVILAYKFGDKYRIESGHRRREAGRKAEIKEYPVFVTD
ncbi:ParB N-terminal domain-containing protein, partial [Mediterraneibacter glycyrrhizinilyticus]